MIKKVFEWFSDCLNKFQIATEARNTKTLFSDIQPRRTKKVSLSQGITYYCRRYFGQHTLSSDRGKEIANEIWVSILQLCLKKKDMQAIYERSVESTEVIRAICCANFGFRFCKVDVVNFWSKANLFVYYL